jgi:hypothetical protein
MMHAGKTRVVSFRLSETEYQHLLSVSCAKGARSLSEIARLVLCSLIDDNGSEAPETLARRITQLDHTVIALNHEVRRLAAVIEAALPGVCDASAFMNRTDYDAAEVEHAPAAGAARSAYAGHNG